MSQRDWRKIITFGPVVAIVAVVIAIVAMDFTFNGTDEPQPENLAPPVPSVLAYTPPTRDLRSAADGHANAGTYRHTRGSRADAGPNAKG